MNKIIIVGAGGFGREVACWMEHMFKAGMEGVFGGFLDDTKPAAPTLDADYPYPLLGRVDDYVPQENDRFVIAIGRPADKLRVAHALKARGARFVNLIHPTATVARTARLGEGIVLFPYTIVSANAVVGDFVALNSYSAVGHDATVGAGSTISAYVDLTGYVSLGDAVFVGTHAAVLPKVRVSAGATIGAGAIVMRNVAEGATVYALPARKL